jgi:hypothetical protein
MGDVLPCLFRSSLESQRSFRRLVVDVIGDADRRLLVVGSLIVIAPTHQPHAAALSLTITKVRLGIKATPMYARA